MKDDLVNDTISRAAALDFIDSMNWCDEISDEAFKKITIHLENLPPAQPDKWDDTVYRKAVEMLLAHFVPEERYAEAVDGLRRLPSAQLAQDLTNGCTDTISRAAALSALNGLTKIFLNNLPPTIDRADAVDAIKELPSAQPGWIPCTPETMPEEDGEYLCTVYRAIPPYHMFHPEENVYVKTVEVKEYRASSGFPSSVKAWQPKPKPWEGGQDGE